VRHSINCPVLAQRALSYRAFANFAVVLTFTGLSVPGCFGLNGFILGKVAVGWDWSQPTILRHEPIRPAVALGDQLEQVFAAAVAEAEGVDLRAAGAIQFGHFADNAAAEVAVGEEVDHVGA
jgi:hypothetical protein